jgi:hypothetical protein
LGKIGTLATIFGPTILTDHTRLDEIYRLRVLAWENSPGKDSINSTKYPDGYRDQLEEKSIHYIATNTNDEIIGAARLTVCHSLDELPYPGIFKAYENQLPPERPFLLYSRLVLHPAYRNVGLAEQFDQMRVNYQEQQNIRFGVATAKQKRSAALVPFKFSILTTVINENDGNYPFSDENLLLLRLS